MRTLILIAGLVLASATAQAGDNRSLSLAGSDAQTTTAPAKSSAPAAPQTAEAPQVAETPKAEAPKYIERPAIVEPKQAAPKAEPSYGESSRESSRESARQSASPVAERTDAAPRATKPQKKRYWSETRIINELHRHGIYW
jgi:hypothetical protein